MTTDQPAISKHLTEGAKTLIRTIEKPEYFLDFLTSLLEQVHARVIEHNIKDEDDIHFYIILIINYIVKPWFIEKKNIVEEVANGLRSLMEFADYEGYERCMNAIIETLAEVEDHDPGSHLFYINGLYKLGYHLRDWHEEKLAAK